MTARDYIWEQIRDYMLKGAIDRIVSRTKEKEDKIVNSEAFAFLTKEQQTRISETYGLIASLGKKDIDLLVVRNKKEIEKLLSDWKCFTGRLI